MSETASSSIKKGSLSISVNNENILLGLQKRIEELEKCNNEKTFIITELKVQVDKLERNLNDRTLGSKKNYLKTLTTSRKSAEYVIIQPNEIAENREIEKTLKKPNTFNQVPEENKNKDSVKKNKKVLIT